ncbi:DUF2971 domain-containing protein [Pseudosporangium ferrugineum]|uniref:DUF2971 domain-containing protein n=1 Tax=Pseudosporangium ferrugineum TaxID=439699 RepID=A0A2T0RBW9_9ACTN|nr:DUF2971 domain-containing protein [Pseudosporangium ferrugineum]PRY18676.1 Protein of unknown function (DUF2971) [Pseudosporangium ferrugineum]
MPATQFDDAVFEAELEGAPRIPTDHLFHYTSAAAAMFGILRSGTLRLSPFEATNDPWESQPSFQTLSVHHDDRDLVDSFDLWAEIDQAVRRHAKVACLTHDWKVDGSVLAPDALRGWNRLATWAHYGGNHSGICLRFDRRLLIDSFTSTSVPGALLRFHGPVQYRHVSLGLLPMDVGQAREFGVDAAAVAHARTYHEQIFFRKHRDWSNEMEYRLVLVDQSVLPAEIPIGSALTGLYLGVNFPGAHKPLLRAALEPYPSVELFALKNLNRTLYPHPVARADMGAQASGMTPRRSGTLEERLAALDASDAGAENRRKLAETVHAEPIAVLHEIGAAIAELTQPWPGTEVLLLGQTTAIPQELFARAPGVAGEPVHLQKGFTCVVENLPKQSHSLIAAGALQALDDDIVRLHGMVRTEDWHPDGNDTREHWRVTDEVPAAEAVTAARRLATGLAAAVAAVRTEFDQGRGRTA